jgi:crotonobetainyl-CoA:carnitine CoA-transferase CaiB-like acyl-CoA transferase
VARCREAGVPATLVRSVREALQDNPLVDSGMLRNPVRFNDQRFPIRSAPPELGADTERIVRELFGDRDPQQDE